MSLEISIQIRSFVVLLIKKTFEITSVCFLLTFTKRIKARFNKAIDYLKYILNFETLEENDSYKETENIINNS